MTTIDKWTRLSVRIHGLVKACELAGSLFARNNNSSAVMIELGKTAEGIFAAVNTFGAALDQSEHAVKQKIYEVHSSHASALTDGGNGPEMRQINIRSGIVALASLEAEVSYLLADGQANIQSKAERAFEHLQRSIVVDETVRSRWQRSYVEGEIYCEKLGAVHLLSHGIWAFKVSATGGQTDLVYQEPLGSAVAGKFAEGLVLTEWKKHDGTKTGDQLALAARTQASAYASAGVLGGAELRRIRYIIIVSAENVPVPGDILGSGITYRHINLATSPLSPSKLRPAA